jgi:hypothetical protein
MGSLMRTPRDLYRNKLDLLGDREVRWEGSWIEPAGEFTLLYGKRNENYELGTGFFLCIRELY